MSSSSLSSSSSSTICSCSGKLCFCALVSPITPPSYSKNKTSSPEPKTSYLVPGCFCFRCELIRDRVGDYDDGIETNFEGEFYDDLTIIDSSETFGTDFESEDVNEDADSDDEFPLVVEAKKEVQELQFLITSLC
jgi:hypothetical protein